MRQFPDKTNVSLISAAEKTSFVSNATMPFLAKNIALAIRSFPKQFHVNLGFLLLKKARSVSPSPPKLAFVSRLPSFASSTFIHLQSPSYTFIFIHLHLHSPSYIFTLTHIHPTKVPKLKFSSQSSQAKVPKLKFIG